MASSSSWRTLIADRRLLLLILSFFVFSLSMLLVFLFFSDSSNYFFSVRDLLPPPPSRSDPPTPISTPETLSNGDYVGGFDDAAADGDNGDEDGGAEAEVDVRWEICRGGKAFEAADYIPCLDNWKAIKELESRRHMEHRERHCPKPSPRCLVPLPRGYKVPVLWPEIET